MAQVRDRLFRGVNPYDNFVYDESNVDLQGWGSNHPILTWGIEQFSPATVIEVGSWKGCSAITMATAMKQCGCHGEIICVDTWLGSPEHWLGTGDSQSWWDSLKIKNGMPTLYETFLTNVISTGLESYITPLPLPSSAAFAVLHELNVKADLIYVDAGHDYSSVLQDITYYWHLLKPDGCMILDDYIGWPGVTEAVHHFVQKHNLALYGENGKAVIARNPLVAIPLQQIQL